MVTWREYSNIKIEMLEIAYLFISSINDALNHVYSNTRILECEAEEEQKYLQVVNE